MSDKTEPGAGRSGSDRVRDWRHLSNLFEQLPPHAIEAEASLLGSMLMAVGLFTSSFTDNQLLAVLCAIIFNYALLQLPTLWHVGSDHSYFVRMLHEQTNVIDHLGNWFGRGMVDSGKVMFYVGGTLFFLFLTVMSLGSRKWR